MRKRRIPKIRIKPIEVSKSSVIRPIKSRKPINRIHSNQRNSHQIVLKNNQTLMNVVFVAYYTKNTPYENEVKNLKESLERLNLFYDIVPIDNLGSWQENTRFKAKFMQQMLLKHTGKNLVYVDADAVIHSVPVLFKDLKADIGIRYQNFKWRFNECLSGTIFMANNEKNMKLCKEWEILNIKSKDNKDNLEQWNLGIAIDNLKKSNGLIVENLPPEYTFIFDSMKTIYPNVIPIIEHFQASRKNKRRI